jgi:hypothetical protein
MVAIFSGPVAIFAYLSQRRQIGDLIDALKNAESSVTVATEQGGERGPPVTRILKS